MIPCFPIIKGGTVIADRLFSDTAGKVSLGLVTLLAVIAWILFSAVAAVGIVFGYLLTYGNVLLLKYILNRAFGITTSKVKAFVMALYYCRFLLLIAVLFLCYKAFGTYFIGATLAGMMTFKIAFVFGNVKTIFNKSQ